MATLNLYIEPAISTRYRIERVMYRGRCSIETGSHTTPQPNPRARLKVPVVVGDARREVHVACWRVSSTARSEHIFVVYRLIDLISSSSIDPTYNVFTGQRMRCNFMKFARPAHGS